MEYQQQFDIELEKYEDEEELDSVVFNYIPNHVIRSNNILKKFKKFKNTHECSENSIEKFGIEMTNEHNKILFNILLKSNKMSFSFLPDDILHIIYSFSRIRETDAIISYNTKVRLYDGPTVYRVTFITLNIGVKNYYIDYFYNTKDLRY